MYVICTPFVTLTLMASFLLVFAISDWFLKEVYKRILL